VKPKEPVKKIIFEDIESVKNQIINIYKTL